MEKIVHKQEKIQISGVPTYSVREPKVQTITTAYQKAEDEKKNILVNLERKKK